MIIFKRRMFMPRQLHNQGRVVGYSAYEIFLMLSDDPAIDERDWLSSTIAMGSSMLLRVGMESDIPANRGAHHQDVVLPSNTRLTAANTIIGSFFNGAARHGNNQVISSTTGNFWATRVTDYGTLINNTAGVSGGTGNNPASPGQPANVPRQNLSSTPAWDSATINALKSYMQIVDGIVVHPGNWSDRTGDIPPQRRLSPDLAPNTNVPFVRIHLNDRVEHPFYLLLTGFTHQGVIRGVTWDPANLPAEFQRPQNGDFLGPGMFPWASKIMFSVPTSFITHFIGANKYQRQLPRTDSAAWVRSDPIIDMTTTNPATFYDTATNGVQASRQEVATNELNVLGDNAAVLTVFQRNTLLPPALFGSRPGPKPGDTPPRNTDFVYPLDTVAPGTLKLFHGETATEINQLNALEGIHRNYGFIRNTSDLVLTERINDTQRVPVARTTSRELTYDNPDTTAGIQTKARGVVTQTGRRATQALSLTSAEVTSSTGLTESTPTQYTIGNRPGASGAVGAALNPSTTGTNGSEAADNLYWSLLLQALANNRSIDILGPGLKELKNQGVGVRSLDTADRTTVAIPGGNPPLIETQIGSRRRYALAMGPEPSGSGNPRQYSLTGSSGDVNIPLNLISGSTLTDDSSYEGHLTWQNLTTMLQENRRAKIGFTIPKFDADSFTDLDVTGAFRAVLGERRVAFLLTFGSNEMYPRLVAWNSTSLLTNAPSNSDGFFRVFLRLYDSPFSTTSKFDIRIRAYLRDPGSGGYEHRADGGAGGSLTADGWVINNPNFSSFSFRASGVHWRGGSPLPNVVPLFADSDGDSPIGGTGGNQGSPIIQIWNEVPEVGENAADWQVLTRGRTMVADISNWGWNLHLTLQGNGIADPVPLPPGWVGNDQIRIIDRSGSFSSGGNLRVRMGSNNTAASTTWGYAESMESSVNVIEHTCSGMYTTV
jgi:hypothetical protein